MEEDYTLAKWLNGEMTEDELAEFQKSADYPLYEKFASYSGQLRTPAFDEKKYLMDSHLVHQCKCDSTNFKGNYGQFKKQTLFFCRVTESVPLLRTIV